MSSFSDFSLGLYEKALPGSLSWPERFEQALRAGYDFVEFSVDDSDERQAKLDWTPAQRREFRSQAEASGLFVPTMALSGHHRFPIGSTDEGVRARAMEIMEKAIILAYELGIRIVQLAGYDELENLESSSRSVAHFSENLEKSVAFASKYGVTLAIENMGVPFMDSVRKVMQHVERINSPWLQAYVDIGNSTAMGQDVAEDINSAAGHIAAMHIKDTRPGIVRNIPFGEGTVDFAECFDVINRTGYKGFFIIEMWANDRADTFNEVNAAREFVERHMRRVWSD